MNTRQAIRFISLLLVFLPLAACAAAQAETPTPAPTSPAIETPTRLPTVSAPTSTPTQDPCLTAPGEIRKVTIRETNPAQDFLIYLPPCYELSDARYPVLYLLHGQTYTQDQWLRIGAATLADEMIHNGAAQPFIIVMPDDHYWYVPAGAEFGARFINNIIPYVDANYRTRNERQFRALGGLSRGGGWAAKLGYENAQLFGAIGLHSPSFARGSIETIEYIIKNMSEDQRPKLWHDIGEADLELGNALLFEQMLMEHDYVHTFYRFKGDHSENYWGAHIRQYFRWYTQNWAENAPSP